MSFAEFIKTAKSELDKLKDPKQSSEFFSSMEKAYLKEIHTLIGQLNDGHEHILRVIKETDTQYLEAKGMEITGHILFSRHGQSTVWGQKKLGLSPNAPISEHAAKNMATTNQTSGALLFYSSHVSTPLIAVSPMNRALQTAGLVIPAEIKNAEITVSPFLVENSLTPSGYDVRLKADMYKLYEQLSFWMSPVKKLLLKCSMWLYSDQDFELLYGKRKVAAEKIQGYGNKILNSEANNKPDVFQNLDYNCDKIEDTKALIDRVNQQDCWMFGHGKNFKAFFQKVLGIGSVFDYGETRRVYKIKVSNLTSLYSPPYALVINQKTGRIEGKYTALRSVPL